MSIPIPRKLNKKQQRKLLVLKQKYPDECFCHREYEDAYMYVYGPDSRIIQTGKGQVYTCQICGKVAGDWPPSAAMAG